MSISEDNSHSSEINKTLEDRKDFLLLSFIFLLTSSLSTYLCTVLAKEFLSLGLMPQELSSMTLILLPQYLKILICPFVDTYFIRKIGRRKTYMIGSLSILSILSFIYSFVYPKLLVELNVSAVKNLALLQLCIILLLEIATESWIVDYIYDGNYKYAAAVKYTSFYLGSIFTISFFHNPKPYFLIMSAFSVILLIYVSYYQIENESSSTKMTCKSLYKRLKSFFKTIVQKNQQIKFYFIFFSTIGFGFAENLIEKTMIGYIPSNLQLFEIFIAVALGTGLSAIILMKYKIFPLYFCAAFMRILINLLLVVICNYFLESLDKFYTYYQQINQFGKAIQLMLIYILVYENTLQKLSATMLILQLLTLKLGQDANQLLSQYFYTTFGSPTDAIIGTFIQLCNLKIFTDYRDIIFYK